MHEVLFTDNDPKVCQWLRNLIVAGHLEGEVLEADIRTITPEQVNGRRQVHFFAGIGGWALALRYAGWPDNRPVWTGSCPCQPFSAAGKQQGDQDDRHVWPELHRLIAECRPPTVFGEQVASRLGRDWLDGVRTDLEALGYAVGAADLCAAGLDAPHIRQRLWWVADAEREGRAWESHSVMGAVSAPDWSKYTWLPCADGKKRRIEPGITPLAHGVPARVVRLRGYGNAIVPQVGAAIVRAYMEATQ